MPANKGRMVTCEERGSMGNGRQSVKNSTEATACSVMNTVSFFGGNLTVENVVLIC